MLTLAPAANAAPTLVIAIGNPSRGDDALGPLAAERIEALQPAGVDVLTDFQLQVEHAIDLLGRQRVIFIDASVSAAAPFTITPIGPRHEHSHSTHALTPATLLQNFQDLTASAPPPAWLLAIRGETFELGTAPSAAALRHLEAAIESLLPLLADATAPQTCRA